jgi:hypothetical protein
MMGCAGLVGVNGKESRLGRAAVWDAHAPSFVGFGAAKPPEALGTDTCATTAFNNMLAIPGANVAGVQFSPAGSWWCCADEPAD